MKPYRTLSSRLLAVNRWYRLRQDAILFPDGQSGEYNVIQKQNAVWVVPQLQDGQIALIYQYRYPIDAWCWEVPAGGIPEGKHPAESAADELLEEIGGIAEAWHFLGSYWTMNGIGDEKGFFYLARGVRLTQPHRESSEVMETRLLPAHEALHMARSGALADAPSALALLLSEPHLR